MATGETTINSLGSIERRWPIQTSENWYHMLQQPLCFPLCLNVVHRAKAESCSAHCGDPFLKTMVIQNTAARSVSERKGSSSLSSPVFSRKFTSLSFTFGWRQWDHFSACFNMSCRIYSSSHYWDSLHWFIQMMSKSVVIWIYWKENISNVPWLLLFAFFFNIFFFHFLISKYSWKISFAQSSYYL